MLNSVFIKTLTGDKAESIAKLHIQEIRTGFISSLGIGFVKALYHSLSESNSCFGFVAEENGKIAGFAVFATGTNDLYRSVIFRKGFRFAFLLASKMISLHR